VIDLVEGVQHLLPAAVAGWAANEGVGVLRRRTERRRVAASEHLQLVDDLLTAGLTFARLAGSLAEAVWLRNFHGITVGDQQHTDTAYALNEAGERVEIVASRIQLRGPRILRGYMEGVLKRCHDLVADLALARRDGMAGENSNAVRRADLVGDQCKELREHLHFLLKVYQDSV
jgi:hypothetical protein